METHKDLRVWQLSMEFVKELYLATKTFPKEELFGLVSQMQRAAVSVPSNIAEGYARGSEKDKLRFLRVSSGSMSELDTQITLSFLLGYIDKDMFDRLSEKHVSLWKQLNSLITVIKKRVIGEELPFS